MTWVGQLNVPGRLRPWQLVAGFMPAFGSGDVQDRTVCPDDVAFTETVDSTSRMAISIKSGRL